MKRLLLTSLLALLTSTLLAGCGGGGSVSSTYSVSGQITDASSQGVAGVTLSFSGSSTTTTGEDGHWRKDGLSGSVTVTPAKVGWVFTPGNRVVTGANAAVNFSAAPAGAPYTASGKIINWLTGLGESEVVLTVSGTSLTTTTDYEGFWTLENLTGTVTVTPSKSGRGFSPANLTLTGATAEADFTAIAPFTGKVVFTSTRSGFEEIWTMSADGTGLKQLTFGGNNQEPCWSPDGSQIVFASMRDGDWEIWKMDANGGNQEQLTFNTKVDCSPVWSPTGDKIAFTSQRDGNEEVYTMNVDGTEQLNVSAFADAHDGHPAWSPDGNKLAFSSDRTTYWQIWVKDLTSSVLTPVTIGTGQNMLPSWAPGSRITFESYVGSSSEVYSINADGSGLEELASSSAVDTDPAWSPDGTAVIFASARYSGGRNELFVVNAATKSVTRLTKSTTGYDKQPSWSN